MTPNRPYLIRAIHQWVCDNDLTPHLLVDAFYPGVLVPQEYVQGEQITLNVAPRAVSALTMTNDLISFSARFGGVPRDIEIPPLAVLAIYARENGQGMAFEPAPRPEPPSPQRPDTGPGNGGRPRLKVIK